MEQCVSCGREPRANESVHPYVAVLHLADAPEGATPIREATNTRGKEYGAFPCCLECHQIPTRHGGLKAHFFERAAARVATQLAGSTDGIG